MRMLCWALALLVLVPLRSRSAPAGKHASCSGDSPKQWTSLQCMQTSWLRPWLEQMRPPSCLSGGMHCTRPGAPTGHRCWTSGGPATLRRPAAGLVWSATTTGWSLSCEAPVLCWLRTTSSRGSSSWGSARAPAWTLPCNRATPAPWPQVHDAPDRQQGPPQSAQCQGQCRAVGCCCRAPRAPAAAC